MKRWDAKQNKYVENEQVDNFLREIASVCKKHRFSISHEDIHGAFVIKEYDETNIDWLLGALIFCQL